MNKICLQLGYYEKLWDLQVTENNKVLESLGISTLADSLRGDTTNASSDKLEKNICEGSNSSYLPRGDEGTEDGSDSNSLEKVSSHTWLGCLYIRLSN